MLDGGFRGWGLEDTDLSYRLHRGGARALVAPKAVNHHQAHPTSGAAKWTQWLWNLTYFVEKHDDMEVSMFANFCTGGSIGTLTRLNDLVVELRREEMGGALGKLLQQSYFELLRFRSNAVA